MDELMDAMATDESPSQISDKIKQILFNKSAERIDAFKTDVANGVFGDVDLGDEDVEDDEIVDEVEDEVEAEDETEVTAELEDQQ
jgi:hypothetical protein